MRILISGASIAGPVLAYWLSRIGHRRHRRRTGARATQDRWARVDLFRPAMEISERMGVLPRIEARATGTAVLTAHRPWASRPARIDYLKLEKAMSDRHVEIMRDDLSEIYYDAARDDVEYLFGDQITSISDDGDVTFEHAAPRRFDVVVGADGLHSGVRRLTFGDDVAERFLGGYLAVLSVPKSLAHEGEMTGYFGPGRVAMVYTADHLDDARAVFIFRPEVGVGLRPPRRATSEEPAPRRVHWDIGRSRHLARRGGSNAHVLLRRDHSTRDDQLVAGSRDAGRRCGLLPRPGGGRQYQPRGVRRVRAGMRAAQADGDHTAAFAAYEATMMPSVLGSRKLARVNAKTIVPGTRWGVRALVGIGRVVSVLPLGVTQAIARLNSRGVRLYDTMPVPDRP